MILTLLLSFTLVQHLTWYENFEQGEKFFVAGKYEKSIASLEAAIAEKPDPQKKAFTRALQTIEYKPYYYLALSYKQTGQTQMAFQMAQKALRGEVVRSNPLYMQDLTPIIESKLEQMTQVGKEFDLQQEQLKRRLDFFELLSSQEFDQAEAYLQNFPEDQKTRLAEVLERQRNVSLRRKQYEDAFQRYTVELEKLISDQRKTSAQALLNSLAPIMLRSEVENYQAGIDSIPDPEVPVNETNERPPLDSETVKLIDDLKSERNKLESLLAVDKKEITQLNSQLQQLADKQNDNNVSFKPEISCSVQVKGRNLTVLGQLLSPFGFKEARLSTAEKSISLVEGVDSTKNLSLSFDESFHNMPYGPGTVLIEITDMTGARTQKEFEFSVEVPWYLHPLAIGLMGLIFALGIVTLLFRRMLRKRKAILSHFNPYIAGVPVREKTMFFGRDQLMDRIEKLVQKNCLMIFGQRRIGKTSLLHQLYHRLSISNNPKVQFFPVFIDLQGVQESDLFHLIMGEILSTYPNLEKDLNLAFEHENNGYSSRHFSKDLKAVIEFLQKLNQKRIHIVFLMDEVDAINDFSEKTNQKLRGIFMKTFSDHLSSIMAGIHLKKHWESSGSPWYNFFEEIPMTQISSEAARDLIVQPVKGIFTFEEEAIQTIIQESGCQPFLIQKICVSLVNQQLERQSNRGNRFKIKQVDVAKVLSNMQNERIAIEGVQNS